MSRFCTAAQLFGFMSASMSETAQPRPLTRRLPRRERREAVLLAQEHEISVRKGKKMVGFWRKNELPHALLTKVAHPHPPSSPATESHQLRHLRPHQRLPCSRSRPMHPRSQPQPQRRPIRSCPRQPPHCTQFLSRSRQTMRSPAPTTRSDGHSPNHSHFLGFLLLIA